LISGNGDEGIHLTSNTNSTAEILVQGNYIGTNAAGTAVIGNGDMGISLRNVSNSTIGGVVNGAGNLISGNNTHGIRLEFLGSTGNLIQGNLIGTAADGTTALGNGSRGISFYPNAPDGNTIGGTEAAAGNIIAYNGEEGIYVESSGSENTIRANRIFSNGDLGIDLASFGVTNNDSGDADSGANLRQNYPVLNTAVTSGSSSTISGTLNSNANLIFTLDFYGNSSCDPSGYGEGEFYLGSDTITTDSNGDVSFISTLSAGTLDNPILTATATDPNGNTSEFSTCITATITTTEPVANFIATPLSGTAPLTVTFTNLSTNFTSSSWQFGDGGTSSLPNPTHVYTQSGAYTVTLQVTGAGGSDTEVKVGYITVGISSATTADFSATPITGTVPLTVTFTNLSTNFTSSSWQFGDGSNSSLANPTHVYAQAGTYTVTLQVTGAGGSDTEIKVGYITVDAPPPTVNFSATPITGTVPLSVTFTNLSTNFTISSWQFGDGGNSSLANPTHVYTQAGTYTVTLQVTGAGGSDTEIKVGYITVDDFVGSSRNWQQIITVNSPTVVGEYGMAFDSDQNVAVLYGGNATGWPYENSTWEFDGT
ncbi:MAG: PKD domain-containing protein, partial [Chloroflexi bacterium]|nr:PKD domain-containing protein [Chloroflexota bacterium]